MTDPSTTSASTAAAGGLRGLIEALPETGGVLGVVVDTAGSTYRKRGALLLRGTANIGWLSGGCLEPELDLAAADVTNVGRARLIEFNTTNDEDLVFGSASGCRGRMRMLLLPLDAASPLRNAVNALSVANTPLVLALRDDGGGTATLNGEHWVWPASGESRGEAWNFTIAPPPRLLLLGAGPETSPLLGFARQLGWYADIVEHRSRWTVHADAADHRIHAAPIRAWAALDPTRYAAALVMSHHFGHDFEHLRQLAKCHIHYIGLLGPSARRDALLADLGDLSAALRPRLHAPIGLCLGGEGPEAIALAIAAELQRKFATAAPSAT